MVPFKSLPAALCAGLLFSPAAFAQQTVQTGTRQALPMPLPGRMAYHPRPPVAEGGQPVIDDVGIFFHIRDEAATLMMQEKATPHDELLRQLNAAPGHADLKIAAAPLSATPHPGLYQACKPGVLVVAGFNKGRVSPSGGIILSADGIAVTNYHVVAADCATLVAMTSDQRVVAVVSGDGQAGKK